MKARSTKISLKFGKHELNDDKGEAFNVDLLLEALAIAGLRHSIK